MASDLFFLWHNPHSFKILGWVYFSLWFLPLFLARTIHWNSIREPRFYPIIGVLAIAVGATGWLGSLNVFKQLGFALSLAALFPISPFTFFWFLSSLCWMPASRWFLKPFVPWHVPEARIAILLITVGSYLFLYHRAPARQYEQ